MPAGKSPSSLCKGANALVSCLQGPSFRDDSYVKVKETSFALSPDMNKPNICFSSLRALWTRQCRLCVTKSAFSTASNLKQRRTSSKPQPVPTRPVPPNGDKKQSISQALQNASEEQLEASGLVAPVNIPPDPDSVLTETHPSTAVLTNSAIIIQRQIELANLLVGFEQANKYSIVDPSGNAIGYIAERDHGFGSTLTRQAFRTHRSFTAHVFDRNMNEVLRFHRPFAWISSRIRVYDPTASEGQSSAVSTDRVSDELLPQVSPLPLADMRVIGEAQQQWAPLRRKYNLFLYRKPPNSETNLKTMTISAAELPLSKSQQLQVADQVTGEAEYGQFAFVDEPFLSWDFSLLSADSRLIGSVNRNFAGFGRELFTDTGVYALRMDSAGMTQQSQGSAGINPLAYDGETPGMTLDQRAVMLATAVSIDFDYFSRHSGSGMGFMPLWFPGFGGESVAGEAGAAGGPAGVDDASPTNDSVPTSDPGSGTGEEVWGETSSPWGGTSDQAPSEGHSPPDEEGEGVLDWLSDILK